MRLKSQATLALMVAISIVVVFVTAIVSSVSYNQYRNQRLAIYEAQSFLLADSALEVVLLELYRDGGYSGGTLATPEGNISVTIANTGGNNRQINAVSIKNGVRREVEINVALTAATNVLAAFTAFGADDVFIYGPNARIDGDLYMNDNLDMRTGGALYGNALTGGDGSSSSTQLQQGSHIYDNPATAGVTEGNVTSVDNVIVTNNSHVDGLVTYKKNITVSSGSTVGNSIKDANLTVEQKPTPLFDYTAYRTLAQANGTYYTSTSQFINFLTANGNTANGVYYIDSTGTLTLNSATPYNITGTIISRGTINLRPTTSYTHVAQNNYPAIVARTNLNISGFSSCNCTVNISGLLHSEGDVLLQNSNYTGTGHSIVVTGGAWSGDDTRVEANSRLVFDEDIVNNVQGFNVSNYDVQVLNWSID